MHRNKKLTGLVLSGGGAYGAYEVGVIKALYGGKSSATEFMPLDADIFTGTSVGSFNASALAMSVGGAQESAARLEKIWTEEVADNGRGNGVYRIRGNPKDYFDPSLPGTPLEQLRRAIVDTNYVGRAAAPRIRSFFFSDEQLTQRALGLVDISAMIDTAAFGKLVERWIQPEAIREALRLEKKALHVTATNWDNGDAEEFNFKHMTDQATWDSIGASAAIPGIFPPVKVGDETFVDGGVVMNTPIKPAVEEGATELHVISLDPEIPALQASKISNTFDTFDRVYTAMMASKITEDIESARWVNEGIDVFERASLGEEVNSGEAQRFMRVASQLHHQLRAGGKMYTPLTIHRYFPKESLGGVLGMLNFHRTPIDRMINQGYADACAHSCEANKCVVPAKARRAMTATAE